MDEERITQIIIDCAKSLKLDPHLCLAIAQVESGLDPTRVRYEPYWKYFVPPDKYAKNLGITINTECVLQAMSWGPLQVMGSVCRELGYMGQLTLLIQPQLGILYGCKKISLLCKKYPWNPDTISAYNQGGPYRLDGSKIYKNNDYVEKVLYKLTALKKSQG